jgi:uncharacterized damage-inducible protein DinB
VTTSRDAAVFDPTEILLVYLQRCRDNLVATLDGLGEHDVRRPMTPSGTNLLGLVKHVASVELGYLGECVGRPLDVALPWFDEESMESGADMFALHDESREWLLDLYRRSWAHGDANVRELGLDARAEVPWWPEERRRTTLGRLVVHMIEETAHHAGHADIVRESIDGRGGDDHDDVGDDAGWREFVARIQGEADHFGPA